MNVRELERICKGRLFKNMLSDIIYVYRDSVRMIAETDVDIRLGSISMRPYILMGQCLSGRVVNMIGGHIRYSYGDAFVRFLEGSEEYGSIELFSIFLFDMFSTITGTGLDIRVKELDAADMMYHIRFDVRIIKGDEVISSKFVLSLDEITAMYFMD